MKSPTKAIATSSNVFTRIASEICNGAKTMTLHAEPVRKAYLAADGDAVEQKAIRHAWRVGYFMSHNKTVFTETRAIVAAEKGKAERTHNEQLAYENSNKQWMTFVMCTSARATGKKAEQAHVVIPRALKAEVAALLASYDFAVVMAALKAAK